MKPSNTYLLISTLLFVRFCESHNDDYGMVPTFREHRLSQSTEEGKAYAEITEYYHISGRCTYRAREGRHYLQL